MRRARKPGRSASGQCRAFASVAALAAPAATPASANPAAQPASGTSSIVRLRRTVPALARGVQRRNTKHASLLARARPARAGRDHEVEMDNRRYDLVLRGGRVICPASGVDGIRDVAVRDGRIAAVEETILPSAATEVVDVSGKLVLPGMIDTHAHVYQYVTGRFGLNPDMVGVRSGVTTVVDQGGPSCMTLPG